MYVLVQQFVLSAISNMVDLGPRLHCFPFRFGRENRKPYEATFACSYTGHFEFDASRNPVTGTILGYQR